MARILPDGWQALQSAESFRRRAETLAVLADGLPDDYTVFHGVHWTRVDAEQTVFGEIDFVVLSPAGHVLLIEQKTGFLSETDEGLSRLYGDKKKAVPVEMARTAEALRRRFGQIHRDASLFLDTLLYCPDYLVRNPAAAGMAPERIVDSTRRDRLAAVVREALPATAERPGDPALLSRFFQNLLELVPDVSALAGQARHLYTRLSGGLAHWARQLELTPHRLRVVGTAGSGKTQLALAVLGDAAAASMRALYVCYNRPLADQVAAIAPDGTTVATYHQLAHRTLARFGLPPDFSQADAFARMETAFLALPIGETDWVDVLVVDEGQDFPTEWRDSLLRFLRPEGAAWWLEDPLQNLYGREPVPLPGWAVLRSATNYRSPQDVLRCVNGLLAGHEQIEAGSPIAGSNVDLLTYVDDASLLDATKRAITQAIGLGFKRDMIALVSFRGREKSQLARHTQLGPYALKRFTGRYDLFGNPEFSDGDVLFESVYRFKGQSAPCVVMSEIDFEALDDLALRKLFVGATRASMKLLLVMSERAAAHLRPRLGEAGEQVDPGTKTRYQVTISTNL